MARYTAERNPRVTSARDAPDQVSQRNQGLTRRGGWMGGFEWGLGCTFVVGMKVGA